MKILNFLDTFTLYKKLIVNPKAGGSRKWFLPENDFKTFSAKHLMPADPTQMWNWDLSLSNSLDQVSSINYQNLFGYAINRNFIRNIHRGKSCIKKLKFN